MKSIFEIIETNCTPTGWDGWCTADKACTLASMVIALRPTFTVEIGVFGGRSFIPMALAHKVVFHGTAIGIDPWTKEASVESQTTPGDMDYWAHIDHEAVYQRFMALVHKYDLNPVVKILRGKSEQFGPPPHIDLLHIDGAHDDRSVADVLRYAPAVSLGKLCVLDDLQWSGGGVQRAEQELVKLGFDKLFPLGTGAVYQRIRA